MKVSFIYDSVVHVCQLPAFHHGGGQDLLKMKESSKKRTDRQLPLFLGFGGSFQIFFPGDRVEWGATQQGGRRYQRASTDKKVPLPGRSHRPKEDLLCGNWHGALTSRVSGLYTFWQDYVIDKQQVCCFGKPTQVV